MNTFESRPTSEAGPVAGRMSLVRRVLVAIDLTGYTRASQRASPLELATFLDRWYTACSHAVASSGGRVVKFMGDACFAIFPEERCADAVAAIVAMSEDANACANPWGLELGANVHLGEVAEGDLGPPSDRRFDVLGREVNHTFRMGRGRGVRLSEPVYRKLPNERRGPWRKDRPPAVYSLGD